MTFFCCSIFRVGAGPLPGHAPVGYGVPCKMLPLIVGTEIPSTLIGTAKIVRIVKNDDKLRGCNKDEYLRETFKKYRLWQQCH